jgi:hypothetical protein
LAKVGALLKPFLHPSYYEWPKHFYFVPNATYDHLLSIASHWMTPMRSLIDGLRIEIDVTKRKVLFKGIAILGSLTSMGI